MIFDDVHWSCPLICLQSSVKHILAFSCWESWKLVYLSRETCQGRQKFNSHKLNLMLAEVSQVNLWGVPEMGVPPNHLFQWDFSWNKINHPTLQDLKVSCRLVVSHFPAAASPVFLNHSRWDCFVLGAKHASVAARAPWITRIATRITNIGAWPWPGRGPCLYASNACRASNQTENDSGYESLLQSTINLPISCKSFHPRNAQLASLAHLARNHLFFLLLHPDQMTLKPGKHHRAIANQSCQSLCLSDTARGNVTAGVTIQMHCLLLRPWWSNGPATCRIYHVLVVLKHWVMWVAQLTFDTGKSILPQRGERTHHIDSVDPEIRLCAKVISKYARQFETSRRMHDGVASLSKVSTLLTQWDCRSS